MQDHKVNIFLLYLGQCPRHALAIFRMDVISVLSPEEFRAFIGPDMRVDRVTLRKEDAVAELLEFYMGKNTMERQSFIIDNLVVEDDTEIAI